MLGPLFPVFATCAPIHYAVPKPEDGGDANFFARKAYDRYASDPRRFIKQAEAQHRDLTRALRQAGAGIEEIEPSEGFASMVFTADPSISLISGGWNTDRKSVTLFSRFKNEYREAEVAISAAFLERYDPKRVFLTSHYELEGTGDNLYDPFRDLFWSGYSRGGDASDGRSDRRAHEGLALATGVEVVSLAVRPPFFHIDTSLSFLPKGHVVAHLEGLQPDARKLLIKEAFGRFDLRSDKYLIPVSRDDAHRFACNLVTIDNTVIMPKCSDDLKERIRAAGYETLTVDVSCFIDSGGGPHCLTNPINQRRKIGGMVLTR